MAYGVAYGSAYDVASVVPVIYGLSIFFNLYYDCILCFYLYCGLQRMTRSIRHGTAYGLHCGLQCIPRSIRHGIADGL